MKDNSSDKGPIPELEIVDEIDLPEFTDHALISSDVSYASELRGLARLISLRAMLRVGDSDYEGAWSDILAIRRLGKMTGSRSLLIEGLVGIAITGIACDAARELMQHAAQMDQPRPQPDWPAMLEQWGTEFATANLEFQYDYGQRLAFIEIVTLLADDQIRVSEAAAGVQAFVGDGTTFQRVERLDDIVRDANRTGQIDWNEGLRWSNTLYDRFIANLRIADPGLRRGARQITANLLEQTQQYATQNLPRLGADDVTPGERSKILCGFFLVQMMPITEQIEMGKCGFAPGKKWSHSVWPALHIVSNRVSFPKLRMTWQPGSNLGMCSGTRNRDVHC